MNPDGSKCPGYPGLKVLALSRAAGSPAIPLFLAQVVSTATQFPAVRQVTLRIAGQPVTSLGGEGMAVPEPLDQSAVRKMLQTP